MSAVNQPAPELQVFEWVQGKPTSISRQKGQVILIFVFQINCPGCFIGGIPETISLYNKFKDSGLVIWGLATAFEDFNINTFENLKKMLDNGEPVGETLAQLSAQNFLVNGCLPYKIPFPVAWDTLVETNGKVDEEAVLLFARRDFPNFDGLPPDVQHSIIQQARLFLQNKAFDSKTFESYRLQGTPSTILIDKKAIVRHIFFGSGHDVEACITTLQNE